MMMVELVIWFAHATWDANCSSFTAHSCYNQDWNHLPNFDDDDDDDVPFFHSLLHALTHKWTNWLILFSVSGPVQYSASFRWCWWSLRVIWRWDVSLSAMLWRSNGILHRKQGDSTTPPIDNAASLSLSDKGMMMMLNSSQASQWDYRGKVVVPWSLLGIFDCYLNLDPVPQYIVTHSIHMDLLCLRPHRRPELIMKAGYADKIAMRVAPTKACPHSRYATIVSWINPGIHNDDTIYKSGFICCDVIVGDHKAEGLYLLSSRSNA